MNIYIWERVENATDRYHPEGGVAVIAENVNRAQQLAKEAGADVSTTPDYTAGIADSQEKCWVFPDSGCC